MSQFRRKIKERYESKFYGIITGQMLRRLPNDEKENLQMYFQVSISQFIEFLIISKLKSFLKRTVEYVDKWFRIERFPTDLDWISLKETKYDHNDIINLAQQIATELDDNQLFDEISILNEILLKIADEKFSELSVEQKWVKIFEADLPNLQKLVSIILSIPLSNTSVERIFSLCGAQWTDPRNSLKVETVKSLAQIKMNYDLNCSQMYNLLISSPELLKKVMSVEKYDFKK